jgi:hypothetical protein
MIKFFEDKHLYISDKGEYIPSVTSLLSKLKTFDQNYWSDISAIKSILGVPTFKELKGNYKEPKLNSKFVDYLLNYVDIEEYISAKENILSEWKEKNLKACSFGTENHLILEKESYTRGYEINPFTQEKYTTFIKDIPSDCQNQSIKENLYDLEDGYYPELLINHPDNIYVGQADKIFIKTINGVRYVDIDDYKFNNKITTFPFKNEDTGLLNTFNKPLDYVYDTKFHTYQLQLSAYLYMMELQGFTPRYAAFTHYKEKGKKIYTCEYQKRDIEILTQYVIDNKDLFKKGK